MNQSNLLSRIHKATCAELAALKTEAEGYILANASYIPYFINHWGRELNRRRFFLCGTKFYTCDGGFRPSVRSEYLP